MLTLRNLSAGYPHHPVLHGINLNVRPGEWLGLIGPNGCGKTTLLRVASGTMHPMQGNVLLQNVELNAYAPRTLAKLRACLPQDFSLDFPFTVREIVHLGRSPHISMLGSETQADNVIVENALHATDMLPLAGQPITQISGGERQRAFIALCLAQEPKLLLLDEPTSHLDVAHQLSLLNLLKELNQKQGLTIVAVFHDLNLSAEYCDRLAVLRAGHLETVGTPEEVLTTERLKQTFGTELYVGKNPKTGKAHVFV
jgi:iron complex transport system ATP-binding protein